MIIGVSLAVLVFAPLVMHLRGARIWVLFLTTSIVYAAISIVLEAITWQRLRRLNTDEVEFFHLGFARNGDTIVLCIWMAIFAAIFGVLCWRSLVVWDAVAKLLFWSLHLSSMIVVFGFEILGYFTSVLLANVGITLEIDAIFKGIMVGKTLVTVSLFCLIGLILKPLARPVLGAFRKVFAQL